MIEQQFARQSSSAKALPRAIRARLGLRGPGLRGLGLVALAVSLLGTASLTQAQDSGVTLDLRGDIAPRCEFTEFASPVMNFSLSNEARIDFALYCNLAMTVHLSSRNGALLNERLAARVGRQDDHGRVYDATLSIENGEFQLETDSIAMRDGVSLSTGETVVFDSAGSLDIQLRSPLAGGYAGSYVDVISIELSPSLATIN